MGDSHRIAAEPPRYHELLEGSGHRHVVCRECGVAVLDTDAHDDWHRALLARLGIVG